MSEEIKLNEPAVVDSSFYDDVNWDVVAFNSMSKEDFMRVRARYAKLFATFLGGEGQFQFYMFKPLPWGDYKNIRLKGLGKDETHEEIIKSCVVWPKLDIIDINSMEAGVILALVQQILGMSNFLKDPNEALKMILKV